MSKAKLNLLVLASLCSLCLMGCNTAKLSADIDILHAGNKFVFAPIRAGDYFHSKIQIQLAEAAAEGRTNRMQSLISEGANVNGVGRYGLTPLFWAMARQNIKGFTFLLDHGANPNVAVEAEGNWQETALDFAARINDSRYLEELLKHGADPNGVVGSTRTTPIFSAALLAGTNNIAILLRHGADINWQTTGGTTPMEYAIEGGAFRAALFLYHAGANPLIKDKWGYSSIDTLRRFGDRGYVLRADKVAYKELIKELTENGLLDRYDLK